MRWVLVVLLLLAGCSRGVPDTLDLVPGGEARLVTVLAEALPGSRWSETGGGGGGTADFVAYAYVFRTIEPVEETAFAGFRDALAELLDEMLRVNGAAEIAREANPIGFSREYRHQDLRCILRVVLAHERDGRALAHVAVSARP